MHLRDERHIQHAARRRGPRLSYRTPSAALRQKVLHFMRAMNLTMKDDREIELVYLAQRIGIEPYASETPSNFYRTDFEPAGMGYRV